LDRPVAIKRLAENLAANEEYQQRFLREARLAARLSHPNIVAVYDAGAENGVPFIVMEYVEGETVSDLLRRRRRSRSPCKHARVSRPRTRRGSFIATSSRRTCWSRPTER